jgi:hypothetical protein
MWKYSGQHFLNFLNTKKALDVYQGKDVEGQQVIVWNRHNGLNQRWRVIYTDKATKERSSGFDREYGFYINRAFYFRSRLPMWRVAETVSNYLRLRRYTASRVRQQTWKFDRVSNTIKSEYTKSYSIYVASNNSDTYLRITTTNSRWW